MQGALCKERRLHELSHPSICRHLFCNLSTLETLPAICSTLGLHSEQPLTLPTLACFAVYSPQPEAVRVWAWRKSCSLDIAVRRSWDPSRSAAGSSILNSQERCTGLPRIHTSVESDASKGRKEPNVLMQKSQILNYAAEPGVLAHANSHCQRGNGNRTEAVFSFKFGSGREKVNLHGAWGWGEDDKRGWCNRFSFLWKLQRSNYG